MIRIGINGFGRIGRMTLRAAIKNFSNIHIVGINDLLDPSYLLHMLKYDSVHGKLKEDIKLDGKNLIINNHSIRLTNEIDPTKLQWNDIKVDVVIESTGLFLTQKTAEAHLIAGCRRVIMSAPSKDDTPMFVYGVNHDKYSGQNIISNASCTTNCLAPLVKILNDKFGIKRGIMTTVHASTATQKVVDSPSKKDWRGGRSILGNIIPSATGAAKAVGKVIPELEGKLTGIAFRVPTANVSVVDLTCELKKSTNYNEICTTIQHAAQNELQGVLRYVSDQVVSTDFIGEECTSVFDAEAGFMLDANFLKAIAWYDNEWGYACKLLEMAKVVSD